MIIKSIKYDVHKCVLKEQYFVAMKKDRANEKFVVLIKFAFHKIAKLSKYLCL